MPSNCPELLNDLNNIKGLKIQFDLAFAEAIKSGNYDETARLKQELETRVKELNDKLYPLKNLEQKNLEQQYQRQIEILTNTGLVERLSTGATGIKVGNQEYPVPTIDDIKTRIQENPEQLDKKISQGFTKLLIVPFGLDLQAIIKKYEQVLLKHNTNKTLLDSDGNNLNLDTAKPVWQWDGYKTESLIYFPQTFDQNNHQGQTKNQLNPWQILLVEDLIDLPADGQGQTINGRKQLEANQTLNDYLKQISTNQEQGLTPESWFALAITYLEEQNKQIDDWRGKGMASYLPGAYFPNSTDAPLVCWLRAVRRAYLYRDDSDSSYSNSAVRSSVRIQS